MTVLRQSLYCRWIRCGTRTARGTHVASRCFSILRSCRVGSYPGIAETGYTCCFTYAANITRSTTPCCDIRAAELQHVAGCRWLCYRTSPQRPPDSSCKFLDCLASYWAVPGCANSTRHESQTSVTFKGSASSRLSSRSCERKWNGRSCMAARVNLWFFGDALDRDTDTTLNALLKPPVDVERFSRMMQTAISATITVLERQYKVYFSRTMPTVIYATITVLERQYKVYFDLDVTEKLTRQTRSARSHNMDAEEVMGKFSALHKSLHTLPYASSSKMWAQKDRTVDYLEREAPDRDALIQFAITRGRKLRQVRRVKQQDIQAELSACIATKLQEKETCGCSGLQHVNAWTRGGCHIRWACPLLITARAVMSRSWHLWLSHQPLMIKKTCFILL